MSTGPKIKTSSIINGKYLAFQKLGAGGCGVIYEVALVKCPQKRYAFKAESTAIDEDPTLPMELDVINSLRERNSQHVVELLDNGKFENYSYIVMTLLGPSLQSLRSKIPVKRFSTFTTLVVIIQALDSLKEIHDIGFVHRDVKPANFAIGKFGTPKERLLHVLDFGIARQYKRIDERGNEILRKPRRIVPFRGTLKYCSLAAQDRKEQGRHDDLWSLFYMLVEFSFGHLPWSSTNDEEEVKREKSDMDGICKEIPPEFELFGRHIAVLHYHATPNYALLRQLLANVFIKREFDGNMKLDWEKGGRYEDCFERKSDVLPRVATVDGGSFDLGWMLKIPAETRAIDIEEAQHIDQAAEPTPLSVMHDDTIRAEKMPGSVRFDQLVSGFAGATPPAGTSTDPEPKPKEIEGSARQVKYNYKAKQPTNSVMKVVEEESKWKKKIEAQKKEKQELRAQSAYRSTQDMVIPDDITERNRKKRAQIMDKKKKEKEKEKEKTKILEKKASVVKFKVKKSKSNVNVRSSTPV